MELYNQLKVPVARPVDFKRLGHYAQGVLNKVDLTKKQTHLWLHGVTNSGKTYFVEEMIRLGVSVFMGPYNNDWVGFN